MSLMFLLKKSVVILKDSQTGAVVYLLNSSYKEKYHVILEYDQKGESEYLFLDKQELYKRFPDDYDILKIIFE